jgi:NADPH:quinone reductase
MARPCLTYGSTGEAATCLSARRNRRQSGRVPARLQQGGSLFVTRPTLAHYIADTEELRWRAREVFDWIASGELDVRIGGRYPLADAAQAQQDLAARRTAGRLLLIP